MKNTNNLIDLIRPDLRQISAYSSARDEFSTEEKMVFLDANENPFDNGLNRYPDPYQNTLKAKISDIKQIPPDRILLGNGSDEVIDLIIRLCCKPFKDQILTLPPTYGMYKVVADLNGIEVIEVPLDQDFQIQLDDLKLNTQDNEKQAKIIFICSPNNPSGNLIERSKIEYILDNFKGLVVIDEAYQDFSSQKSWSTQLDHYPHLIVLQTFSKAWGMAGARLGMCFAHPQIIAYLNKIKPPYNINQLTQKQVLKALHHKAEVFHSLQILLEERSKLIQYLQKIEWVETIYPTEANFILIKVDDANKRYDQLLERKIVVRNRHHLPGCKNCLRISIGTPDENKILMNTLKQL